MAGLCQAASRSSGSGHSGQLSIDAPGQTLLDRTCVQVEANGAIEFRLSVGLPAFGRRIAGDAAHELLVHALPHCVHRCLDLDPAARDLTMRAARKAEVRMVAVLHQRALNVEDIECLERGAIIPLPVEDRMHIDFRLDTPGGVATQPIIAEGVLGATDGRRAVKLAEPLDDSVLNLLAPYAS